MEHLKNHSDVNYARRGYWVAFVHSGRSDGAWLVVVAVVVESAPLVA